jgi:two-component system, chemotaxis family, CheB/CheR fusion protein
MAKSRAGDNKPRRTSRTSRETPQRREFEDILHKLREARNFDFRSYKRATLYRRILRRVQDRRLKNIADYSKYLDGHPAEYDTLLAAMFIKATSFFRDKETWDALSTKIIPKILAERRPGEAIRVWCAGCATGEEAFSVAITLAEVLGPSFNNQEVKVFGTDVDEQAIVKARQAHFTPEQVEQVAPRILNDWFVEETGGYTVRKDIRRAVVFGVNNLLTDAPISRIDMILCRNLFIYFDGEVQKRVLTRFHYALRQNGILVLGKSELIPFAARIFEPVDLARRMYRKDGRRESAAAQERLSGLAAQEMLDRAAAEQGEHGGIDRFHRDVLHSTRLPIVVTGQDGTVLLWNSGAAALWSRAEHDTMGKKLPSLNLAGLSGDLLIEKTRAVREGHSPSERASGTIARNGSPQMHLEVEVSPLLDSAGQRSGLVYLAHDVTAYRAMEVDLRKANEERLSALEEMQTVNEEMQSSNEEMETTNEELQSANEELQTTNEELQSTNEELETTNEELQSTNAELDATNRELAHRTEEMNKLAFYQRTIIRSLSAAVVVVDAQGRITMWSLAAERLLGLAENEALGQILWTLSVPAIPRQVFARMRKALSQNLGNRAEEVEYELPTGGMGTATLIAVPIVDGGAGLGGVIIFEDTTRQSALVAENEKLKANNGTPQNHA